MKKAISVFMVLVFVALTFCSCGSVKEKEITVNFEKLDFVGTYSGEYSKKVPNGNGTFKGKCAEYTLDFTGEWENGTIKNGTISTNHYTITLPDTTRTGEYKGQIVDGKASGQGEFTATNDSQNTYVYTGEFKNGIYNGQGERHFTEIKDDFDPGIEKGIWIDGEFCPTFLEYITYLGSSKKNLNYSLSDNQIKFLKENEKLFIDNSKSSYINKLVDDSITPQKYTKQPSKYENKLVHFKNYKVHQIDTYDSCFDDSEITTLICTNSNFDMISLCYIFMIDKNKTFSQLPIYEDSNISFYAYPLGYSSYENTDGGICKCMALLACNIEKA